MGLEIFFFANCFKYKFNFFNSFRTVHIMYFILGEFGNCDFQGNGLFLLSRWVYMCRVFFFFFLVAFPYYSFSICEICNDIISLISDIANLFTSFIFFVNLATELLFIALLKKLVFSVNWFSLSFFHFQLHLFLFLPLLFLFFFLGFVLPSFLSFLWWKCRKLTWNISSF